MSDKRKIFISTYYVFFVNGILALTIGAIMPFIKESYHLSYQVTGLLISAHSVGNLFSSFTGGVLPLYIGRKKSILQFVTCGIIAFLLMTLTGNPVVLMIAFFLTGVNRGAVSNSSNSIINHIATGQAWAFNVLHSMFAVGAFAAPFLALLFTSRAAGNWMYMAWFLAFLILTELITYKMMEIPDNRPVKKEKQGSNWEFLKNPGYLLTCGLLFTYLCAEQAINGWLVTYLKDSGIMNGSFAQIMSSVLWIFILIGRLLTAFLSGKIPARKILLFNGIGYLCFFIILITSRSFIPAAIGVIGAGFFMAAIYPTAISMVGPITREYPLALSFLLTVAGLGAILMPALIGIISDRVGIAGGMTAVIIAVFISFLLIIHQKNTN